MAKRGRGRPRKYTKEERLLITGRRTNTSCNIVLQTTPIMRDSLRVYGIVRGIPGGAAGALRYILGRTHDLATINEYMQKQKTTADRERMIANMEAEGI